jgi:hypothetical protein
VNFTDFSENDRPPQILFLHTNFQTLLPQRRVVGFLLGFGGRTGGGFGLMGSAVMVTCGSECVWVGGGELLWIGCTECAVEDWALIIG